MHLRLTKLFLLLALLSGTPRAPAAPYVAAKLTIEKLPEEQDYQRELRRFLGTLTAADYEVAFRPLTVVAETTDTEKLRHWLYLQQPTRLSGATVPAERFTLAALESQPGLAVPCSMHLSQSLAWLAQWDYPGNPYRGSRPLRLRALTLAMVDTMMLDYLYEHNPGDSARADYLGGNLIWLGYTLLAAGEALPPPTRAALVAGLRRHAERLQRWGPKGLMTDMDLFAPVGLWYLAQAVPELKPLATDYARPLFTDPHYYNRAGYFVDNGCFDTSYNGISLYFGSWAALATDWPFAREALVGALRLRAHLCFPDPAGGASGPSAMSSRTSGDPPRDQWQFANRMFACALLDESAAATVKWPDAKALDGATARLVNALNAALPPPAPAPAPATAPATPPAAPAKPPPPPPTWMETHWSSELCFPAMHATDEQLARVVALIKTTPPPPLPAAAAPYAGDTRFVRAFGDAFVIARLGDYAVAVHTGPVGRPIGHMGRPYGYGGGQIAAFWTPATGPVWLTRRRGVQGATVWDKYEEWRQWPVHSVSGLTAAGELVTANRIEQPEITRELAADRATLTARGAMPKYAADCKSCGPSACRYERTFELRPAGVQVTTRVQAAPAESLQELYETLPLFRRESAAQPATAIAFEVDGQWVEATPAPVTATAVRAARAKGALRVRFAAPQRVQLAPERWVDGFQTSGELWTVLVDLLPAGPRPHAFTRAEVSYELAPEPPAATP